MSRFARAVAAGLFCLAVPSGALGFAPGASGEGAASAAAPGSLLLAWPCLDAPGCDGARTETRPPATSGSQAPEPEVSTAPLPATLGLLGLGMAGLALMLRRGRPGAG